MWSSDGTSAKSVLELTPTSTVLSLKNVSILTMKQGEVMWFGMEPIAVKAPMVLLGPAAAPANAALFLLAGVPSPSATCFLSP
jgi:hypothetical protein